MHLIRLFKFSSQVLSSTSAYLFLKAHDILLRKIFPQHFKTNAECTVAPLTLIFVFPVGNKINTFGFQRSHYGIAATLLLTG